VPSRLRICLPFFAAADLSLLCAAHLLKGASMQVSGEAPLGLLQPHTASEDNLISAARRLGSAHAWVSFAIVVGLSGLWPYVKLLATLLVVMLVDARRCAVDQGLRYLWIIEVLGKYSFADVFLTCINAVIFDISTGGKYRIMGLFNLELNMWMELQFACAALITAVTFSAFLTHWALHELHRMKSEAHVAVGHGSLDVPGVDPPSWSRYRILAAVAALCGAGLVVLGSVLPLARVERGGFLGNLIRPTDDRSLSLSVFSICSRMLHSGGSNAVSTILVVYFFALTVVAPLLEFVLLAVDAFSSRSGRIARRARMCARWAHSFGCLDVLLIVVGALVLELHTVVKFNIGDECEPFGSLMGDKTLLRLAGLGFAASTSCFDPRPSLACGSAAVLGAVALRWSAWHAHEAMHGVQKDD